MSSRFLSLQCLASELEEGQQGTQPYSRQPGRLAHSSQPHSHQPSMLQASHPCHPSSLLGGREANGSQQLSSSEADNKPEEARAHPAEAEPRPRPQHPYPPKQSSKQPGSSNFHTSSNERDSSDVLGPVYSNEGGSSMMLRSPGSNSTKSSVSQESGVASGSEEEEVKYKTDKYNIEEIKMGKVEGGKYNVRSERLICQRWWGSRTGEAEVRCSQCGAAVRKSDLVNHQGSTCIRRPVPCIHCKTVVEAGLLGEHQSVCGYRSVECVLCRSTLPRNMLDCHRKDCTGREKVVQAKEEEALDRRRDHWAKPPLLNEEGKAGATQDQAVMRNNVPTGTQGPSGKYGSSEKYGRPSERHGGVCYKANRLEGLEICPHTGAGCTWRGTELSKHLASHVEAHLALVTQECRRQAEEINRLRGKLEEASVGREGVLVWRVAGVGARLREARSSQGLELVSRPFYTGSPGYKLQASLFLNGNGAGEGSHVSLYIKVIAGEHDSILKWPFRHTVSFTLLDQNGERTQAVNVLESFLPDPTWENFSRPTTQTPNQKKEQLGFGFPKFVTHEMLGRRNYVKDDTLFLKIRADPKKGVCV